MLAELREELRRRGAPTHGRYEELVARLDSLVVAEVEADAIDMAVGGLSRESLSSHTCPRVCLLRLPAHPCA
jgi:hypothetical protein